MTAPFAELADTMLAAGAMTTGLQAGIFDRLVRGPAGAATLAADCGLTERGTALLLDALAAMGVVDTDGECYRPGPLHPRDLQRMLDMAGELPAVLRTGDPVFAAGTPDGAGDLYPGAVAHLASLMSGAAATAAAVLMDTGVTGSSVLDVGAGAAPWSRAVADALPTAQITALDLPTVLPTTRAAVEAAGHTGRYRFLAGDVFTLALPPQTFDLVLVGNLCHLLDEPANQRLFVRLAATVRPGGTLAVLDVLPDTPTPDQRALALYALGLLTRTRSAGLHPFTAYHRWLTAAGCTDPERVDVSTAPPVTLVHAQHPTTDANNTP